MSSLERSGQARALAVLLAAAHVSAGCYYRTTGKPWWETVKGSDRRDRVQLENVVETSRVYEIRASEVSFDGETVTLPVHVTATRSEFAVHRADHMKTERQMSRYVNPTHGVMFKDEGGLVIYFALLLGATIPLTLAGVGEWDDKIFSVADKVLLYLLGTASGVGLVAVWIGDGLAEKKTAPTGEERTTVVKSEETRTLADKKVERNPAAGVRVRASSSSVRFVTSPGESSARTDVKTDGAGRAAFAVAAPRSIIGTSKDDVCTRTVGATELKCLTEKPRAPLLSEVEKATSAFPIRLQFETLDPGVTATYVKNARAQVAIDAWAVPTDKVRRMLDKDVGAFVSRINSTVREVRVALKDAMTRVPVAGAKVSIQPDAEGPGTLTSRYATGTVAKKILAGVRAYQHGARTIDAKGPSFTFSARVPCELLIYVEHPDYAPADLSTELDPRHLKKTVFLTRAGRGEARVADE